MNSGAALRIRRKVSLKNYCLDIVRQQVLCNKIELSQLQGLSGDILEDLFHNFHCAKQLTSPDIILALLTPFLNTLNLSLCFNLNDNLLETILKKCINLHVVNLSACHDVTEDGIKMIGNYCPELESLNIANCHTITAGAIQAIVDNCPKVHSFNLASCWAMEDIVLEHLGRIRERLQYVNICGCKLISKVGVSALLDNNIESTIQPNCHNTCPSLHSFYLSNCKANVTTASVLEIAAACPALTALNISSIKTVTDIAMVSLGNNCPRLRKFYASWCPVTDRCMADFVQKCTNLQVLNLSGCNKIADLTCIALSEYCPNLKKLNLGSTKVTFNGIVKVLDSAQNMKSVDFSLCKLTNEEKEKLKGYYIFHVKLSPPKK